MKVFDATGGAGVGQIAMRDTTRTRNLRKCMGQGSICLMCLNYVQLHVCVQSALAGRVLRLAGSKEARDPIPHVHEHPGLPIPNGGPIVDGLLLRSTRSRLSNVAEGEGATRSVHGYMH